MAQSFSVRVYGEVQGADPYTSSFTRSDAYSSALVNNFPAQNVLIHPVSPGQQIGSAYVYSIIEVPPTGLNIHSRKYAVQESVATLATLRNV